MTEVLINLITILVSSYLPCHLSNFVHYYASAATVKNGEIRREREINIVYVLTSFLFYVIRTSIIGKFPFENNTTVACLKYPIVCVTTIDENREIGTESSLLLLIAQCAELLWTLSCRFEGKSEYRGLVNNGWKLYLDRFWLKFKQNIISRLSYISR